MNKLRVSQSECDAIEIDGICTIDTSANITSIDFGGLDGLKKVTSDIIPD